MTGAAECEAEFRMMAYRKMKVCRRCLGAMSEASEMYNRELGGYCLSFCRNESVEVLDSASRLRIDGKRAEVRAKHGSCKRRSSQIAKNTQLPHRTSYRVSLADPRNGGFAPFSNGPIIASMT